MALIDTQFAGAIPRLYDRFLGPLLFEPYAREISTRAASLEPAWVLEIAAGTGILTGMLAEKLPDAHLVATDLNPAMLDVARTKIHSARVTFAQADALDLPFEEDSFDIVVCQFGVMFYPDKVRGNAEARRVLRGGGTYIAAIWDRLDANPASEAVNDAVAQLYPHDPPSFLARTPFGYADPEWIERDLRAAGFDHIRIDTVRLRGQSLPAHVAAQGLVAGCPLAAEVQERNPDGLQAAVDASTRALQPLEKAGRLDCLSAHIVTAIK